MTLLFYIILALIIMIFFVILDFKLGKQKHRKSIPAYEEPEMRQSECTFFAHGDELFDHLFASIRQANDHIHMMFYIFREDNIGKKMLSLIEDKAKEGVEVRLLVDWVGWKVSRKTKKRLLRAGVSVQQSNRPRFPFIIYKLNERNHRKITVIDGKKGYLGGFNVGDEYLGRDPKFGLWRDYHLFIEGESVSDLQEQFLLDWKQNTEEAIEKNQRLFPSLQPGSLKMQLKASNGAYVEESFAQLINQAKRSLFIGSPYFIPGEALHARLIEAAKRGVDIQILLPKNQDHPFVQEAAYPYFKALLEEGCDIHQFYRGFFHSKAVIVDDEICDIGTANFDLRSFHINYEMNCFIYDEQWIEQIKQEIKKDLVYSQRVTLEDLKKRSVFDRMKEVISSTLAPLL
ncbi:cardiolipin synthase [Texcoconibacillus texcoconensis]|uniref:Cardiolipin synthase n=1 Tax=Texcoconibacillus texcoconensis TaxID=1095777 RepID=A0A840QS04_9BACI|nr:cardiolipin synthase [Texcoconibacillus texcoconensis]MBB5174119.1 cardiolipin synthase [Texcoconibacillus texcoconensis]